MAEVLRLFRRVWSDSSAAAEQGLFQGARASNARHAAG